MAESRGLSVDREVLGDTWLFDGTTWKRVETPAPPARQMAAMAYDAARERVVLFGGVIDQGMNYDEHVKTNDLWRFDGTKWH